MVPLTLYATGIIWSPHMYVWFLHTLYGVGILWSPLPCMEQVSYGPPTCTYGSPTHVQYDFFRPACMVSLTCMYGPPPTCTI